MSTTASDTNGHADTPQPVADTPRSRKEARVQLLVKPATHRLVRQLATRLGRSNDAVVRRAVHLLDRETKSEQVKSDDDWADEAAS